MLKGFMTVIADSIRNCLGATEKINAQSFPEKISQVYEAGKASMVDKDTILPVNVSGSYISLDDVSEVRHDIECRVSGGDINPRDVRLSKFGKNLVPYPFKDFTAKNAGITATDLGDGGVHLSGTATSTAYIHLHKTDIGNRYISGKVGKNGIFFANKYNDDIWVEHHNANHLTYIVVEKGTVCDGVVFYPQIEVGAKESGFEKGLPYETFVPDTGGMVFGIQSSSPHVNIFCNTGGVTLDVIYNKSYGIYKCEERHEEIKAESFEAGKQAEYDRFWDGFQDNGNRTNYRNAFGGVAWNDSNFRPKYDITIYEGYMAFAYADIVDLAQTLETAGVTMSEYTIKNAQYMFMNATKLTRVPSIRLLASTLYDAIAYGMFDGCTKLKTIDKIILEKTSQQSTFWTSTFNNCSALENILFEGVIGAKISFSQSTKLSKDSITSIINALSTTTSGLTVSLSKTAVNNAFSINVDDESTYPEGSEFYTLRHSKDNWTFSYV